MGNSNTTAVASSTSEGAIVAQNESRDGISLYYDGAAILYILAGTGTASSSLYTAKMGSGYLTYWEAPADYKGAIRGVWSAAVGSVLVTEYA